MKRVIITGGGTAGHINPALAIAGEIRNRYKNVKILFVGTKRGLEAKLVPAEGYDITFIKVEGIRRSLSPKNIAICWDALRAVSRCKKIIKDFKPDLVIGTGGYVSGPVVKAAQSLGIKTAIHEQNAYWGITTRMLSKKADRIFLSFMPDGKLDSRMILTGNPVRGSMCSMEKDAARRLLGIDKPLILSYGGSGGATKLNEAVADMLKLSQKDKKYIHIHGTGKRDFEYVNKLLSDKKITASTDIRINEYIYDMPRVMAASDLVVCRAGAITLAELAMLGKPSILIPSPNVTANHQYHNAMVFVNGGAAELIEDKELCGDILYEKINSIINDSSKLSKMSDNAYKLASPDAAKKIVDELERLIQ